MRSSRARTAGCTGWREAASRARLVLGGGRRCIGRAVERGGRGLRHDVAVQRLGGERRRIDRAALHLRIGRGEGLQAAGDADAAARDRRLELRPAERQHAGAGERAEQHRADDAAVLLGHRRHVEADEALGRRGGVRQQGAARRPGRRRARSSRRSNTPGGSRRASVVRSGVTRPRWIARPPSISSEASTTSTSPGSGISASTGWAPSASARAAG